MSICLYVYMYICIYVGSTPGPHRALPASDWQPDSCGHSALPPSPLDDPISCLATGGRLPAPGAHGPFSPGSRACEETPKVMPSVPCILRICNRSNHCYANSVLCALCWVEQLLSPAQVIWLPVMHALTQRMSLQAPVADLWDSLQWILMHAQWRFPHHQHDAAEYLCYCRRFFIPDLMRGVWQSRLLLTDADHAQCQVRDCGDAWPILFATPLAQAAQSSSGLLTVQSLVHNWQNQAVDGFTAFESAAIAVVLQLNRFCKGAGPSRAKMTLLLFRTLASCCRVFSTPLQLLLRLCSFGPFSISFVPSSRIQVPGQQMATIVPFYAPAQPVLPLPALALCHHLLRASGTVMMIKDRGSAMLSPTPRCGKVTTFSTAASDHAHDLSCTRILLYSWLHMRVHNTFPLTCAKHMALSSRGGYLSQQPRQADTSLQRLKERCIYVYMYICIYVYMYICIYVYMYICIYVFMYLCIYVFMYICIYVYMYICIYVYMYICIYVFMYICNYL